MHLLALAQGIPSFAVEIVQILGFDYIDVPFYGLTQQLRDTIF